MLVLLQLLILDLAIGVLLELLLLARELAPLFGELLLGFRLKLGCLIGQLPLIFSLHITFLALELRPLIG